MASRKLSLVACGLILSGFVLSGCARSTTTTVVRPDGSWTRSIRFATKPLFQAQGAGDEANPKLEDAFALPTGAPWRVTRGSKEDETFYLVERTVPAGEAVRGDVAVKESKKVAFSNEATVRQVAPGRWEYREVFRCLNKQPLPRQTWDDEEKLRAFRKALPARLANAPETPAALKDIALRYIYLLSGPPEPMIMQLMLEPDLARHLITARLISEVDKVLAEKFGDRLTAQERYQAARQFTLHMTSDLRAQGENYVSGKKPSKKDAPSHEKKSKKEAHPVMLTFAVKMPGRIVATNGKINPVTGEVFWGLYPLAAEIGDVTLSATSTVEAPSPTPTPTAPRE